MSGQASIHRAATKVTFAMDKAFKIRLLTQIKKPHLVNIFEL